MVVHRLDKALVVGSTPTRTTILPEASLSHVKMMMDSI